MTNENEKEQPTEVKEPLKADYEICFVFECKDCNKINAITDPKLVVVGLHGQGVSITCPACKREHILHPKNRILAPELGAPGINRHARRSQKKLGIVGVNGKAIA